MLKVSFVSATDLLQFAHRHRYTLWADACFCDQPEEPVLLAYPPIYWQGIRLDPYHPVHTELTRDSDDAPLTYYVYLATEDKGSAWPTNNRAYDLSEAPREICLTVRGGSMAGFGYKSNAGIIPTTVITAALRHLPPAFR